MNKLVKISAVITILTLFLFNSTLNAQDNNFSHYSKQILAIDAKPKAHLSSTKMIILHPLIKDKEIIINHISRISWKGNKCTRTITGYKQLKGKKAKGKTGVGQTFKYKYIPKNLRSFCSSKKISKWKKSHKLKLEKKSYKGYSFDIVFNGKKRKGSIYLTKDGQLKAISFGFQKAGISHAKTMKESATIWYFDIIKNKTRLVKIVETTAEKKSGFPFVKIITETYSKFN